jgi:peptidoglycan/LPS O-acetylase OafA/YrhL
MRIEYRPEIDGLRAVAVLSIVGFHAFPEFLPGGFVGVDVFYVVSGYLITRLILQDLVKGDWSLVDFYCRRIRRIFPALILVLAACFAFGWFVLFAQEFKLLGKHIAAGAGFVANIVFSREPGYFDISAELKPLLHLWSLGVEEQFYIVWPFLVWLGFRLRNRGLWLVVLLGALSFTSNVAFVRSYPVETFYWPTSRFWELAIGGVLAYSKPQPIDPRPTNEAKAALGLGLILLSSLWLTKAAAFPGVWASLPTIGAFFIIAAGPAAWFNRVVLSHRWLVGIGLISYPLYLWHWPLLTFARIVEGGTPSWQTRTLLVFASAFLAALTFQFLERPVRRSQSKRVSLGLLFLVAIVGYVGFNAYQRDGLEFRKISKYDSDLKWNTWTDKECYEKYGMEPCLVNSEQPRILLLGDSEVNHLFPGLVLASGKAGVMQIGSCPPLDSVTNPDQGKRGERINQCFSQGVLELNLRILGETRSIQWVIISSAWNQYLDASTSIAASLADEKHLTQADLVVAALDRTIRKIESLGKRVIFTRKIPSVDDLKTYCRLRDRPQPEHCSISKESALEQRSLENTLMGTILSAHPNVGVADPMDTLCDDKECHFIKGGKLLYRDGSHLSYSGSELVAKEILGKARLLSGEGSDGH